jgi:hypothetical protein
MREFVLRPALAGCPPSFFVAFRPLLATDLHLDVGCAASILVARGPKVAHNIGAHQVAENP